MEAPCFRDVGEDATLEDHPSLDTLAKDPREVYSRVDAYRGEFGTGVAVFWKFGLGQDTELRYVRWGHSEWETLD